jgi:tRNA nucleotidyltransferase (CCA-adding enzyme)
VKNEYSIENFSLILSSLQQEKINFLTNFFKPYTQNIYVVGGFLRDQILGIQSDDIDIEIYDIDRETFYSLMEKLGASELSKNFFVYNYEGIDISLPRIEIKTGEGYHGFKMETTNNPVEAIERRDFTCNTLMFHIYENKLYDYCGGVGDIKNKILRVVNPNSFQEDSVRFLRAIRFMAYYSFAPETVTKEILKSMHLEDITKTKIEKELKKLFL